MKTDTMRIGLIAMSGKPVHAGHDALVRLAAKENNKLLLFVSTSDRKRPKEFPIFGKDMFNVWKKYLEPTLPKNVSVTYGGSPVGHLWDVLAQANEENSRDTYVIYSDPQDMDERFTTNLLQKYAPDLYENGQIVLEPIQRTTTRNVSGTQMRKWLMTGNKENFIDNLPPAIQHAGDDIWDVLQNH